MIYKKGKNTIKNETIIFVHGAWHGAWCWELFMDYFSDNGYDCYALNLRHHSEPGPKRKNNKIKLNDYVDDLHHSVSNLKQTPILIGHSMGGAIIQRYIKKYDCKQVVLMASCPPRGNWRTNLNPFNFVFWIVFKRLFSVIFNGFELHEIIKREKEVKQLFFSNNIDNKILKETTTKLTSESITAVCNFMYPLKHTSDKSIPMFVVGAKDDKVISEDDFENTHKTYNADFLYIENIAHDMMLDTNYLIVAENIFHWLEKN